MGPSEASTLDLRSEWPSFRSESRWKSRRKSRSMDSNSKFPIPNSKFRMSHPLAPVALKSIQAAASRIAEKAIRTPLVRLNVADSPAEIYLKLENLQPIGSFQIRGAANRILSTPSEQPTCC